MYKIVRRRKLFFAISIFLVLVGLIALIFWGLRPGIDFTGGTLVEFNFIKSQPSVEEIKNIFVEKEVPPVYLQPAQDNKILIRTAPINEEKHQEILKALKEKFPESGLEEIRFESIGPTIGKELRSKAYQAIIAVVLLIILYIAYAFRKVSKPVASWKFGVAAIIALIHDILVVIGVFAIIGHFLAVEVDALFITALLTVMGYSVHDTIVVFDRIREHLGKDRDKPFEIIAEKSINETIMRSINTSMTVFLTLMTLFLFGGPTIKNFILALLIGIVVGTYSSIFIASNLLVTWEKLKK